MTRAIARPRPRPPRLAPALIALAIAASGLAGSEPPLRRAHANGAASNARSAAFVARASVRPGAAVAFRATQRASPLARKLGHLVFTGFLGTTVSDETRNLLREVGVGGMIIHSGNVRSRGQLLALTRSLRRTVARPIFVSVTQEPGVVDHLAGIFPDLSSPPELARSGPRASRKAGCTMGNQLASVGIDVNFAPVVDVVGQPGAYIGSRSYGSDPDVVALHGAAFVRGLEQAGVFPVVKHFPGHGWVEQDSHAILPVDPRPLWKLRQRDLVPFDAAFDAGAPGAMTAHILYRRIDADLPSSLSPEISTGILRDELGFDGLVVTDSLGMGALSRWPMGQRAVKAIAAGADMVLLSSSPDAIPGIVAALRKALRTGKLSRDRAKEALSHVQAAFDEVARLRSEATACPGS